MAEEEADLLERELAVLAEEIHGDVAGFRDRLGAALAGDRLDGDVVVLGDGAEDGVRVGGAGQCRRERCERLRGYVDRDGVAGKARVGEHAVERAFELADVVGRAVGEEAGDIVGEVDLLVGRLGAEDGEAGLLVRGLDVGDKPPTEAGGEAGLEAGDGRRRAVAGDDDLAAVGVEVVEGVEELLLGAALAGKELDVVQHE